MAKSKITKDADTLARWRLTAEVSTKSATGPWQSWPVITSQVETTARRLGVDVSKHCPYPEFRFVSGNVDKDRNRVFIMRASTTFWRLTYKFLTENTPTLAGPLPIGDIPK